MVAALTARNLMNSFNIGTHNKTKAQIVSAICLFPVPEQSMKKVQTFESYTLLGAVVVDVDVSFKTKKSENSKIAEGLINLFN